MAGRRLRVLFISHTYVVGVNQQKLHALAASGAVDVGLLVPKRWHSDDWGRRYDLESPYPEIKTFASEVWFEGRAGGYLYPASTLRRAVSKFRPDFLQVEEEAFSLSAFQSAVLARTARKPLAILCWENTDRPLSALRRAARKFVLKTAQLIIAGNKEAGDLVQSWGYDGPLETLPQLGVDTEMFCPRSKDRSRSPLVIGFVGRLVHEKGVDLLLVATRLLRNRGHSCHSIIFGSGPEEEELKSMAAKLRIADLVEFKGAVRHDEVPDAMARLDVLVLPSRSVSGWKEQFGHVLIEAMSMGIPVVGSTCGEIPRVIGQDDLVFPEGNSEKLADILQKMIRDSAWRDAAGRYGIDRVRGNYTHERVAERLIAVWHQVLGGNRA